MRVRPLVGVFLACLLLTAAGTGMADTWFDEDYQDRLMVSVNNSAEITRHDTVESVSGSVIIDALIDKYGSFSMPSEDAIRVTGPFWLEDFETNDGSFNVMNGSVERVTGERSRVLQAEPGTTAISHLNFPFQEGETYSFSGLVDGDGHMSLVPAATDHSVGIWHFDEGAGQELSDASDRSNQGVRGDTDQPDDTDPDWTSGYTGAALDFDGTDDYAHVPYSDSISLSNGFTLASWVKIEDTNRNFLLSQHRWVDRDGDGDTAVQGFWWDASGGGSHNFVIGDGYDSTSIGGGSISLGSWVHIAAVYNRTHVSIYTNGSLTYSERVNVDFEQEERRFHIGSYHNNENDPIEGKMDEILIYDRSLSQEAVSGLFSTYETRIKANDGKNIGSNQFDAGINNASLLFSSSERTMFDDVAVRAVENERPAFVNDWTSDKNDASRNDANSVLDKNDELSWSIEELYPESEVQYRIYWNETGTAKEYENQRTSSWGVTDEHPSGSWAHEDNQLRFPYRGYWTFDRSSSAIKDGLFFDTSMSGHHLEFFGRNNGETGVGEWETTHERGDVLSFDGTDGEATVSTDDFKYSQNDDFSISVWLNWQGGGTRPDWATMGIVNHGGYSPSYGIDVKRSGAVSFGLRGSSESTGVQGPIDIGSWYHVVARHDASANEVDLYVNDEYQGSSTYNSIDFVDEGADLTFGSGTYVVSGSSDTFNGYISDPRIYDRVLTEAEVSELNEDDPVRDGLRGHWPLDEGQGTTLYDESTWTEGVRGQALSLDGTDDYAKTESGVPVATKNGTNVTYAAWIKTNGGGSVIGKTNNAFNNGNGDENMYLQVAGGNLRWRLEYKSSNDEDSLTGSVPVADGQWHHVMGIRENWTYKLYVDGELDEVFEKSDYYQDDGYREYNAGLNPDAEIDIGHYRGNPQFNGKIDDAMVLNGSLSSAEREQMYPVELSNGLVDVSYDPIRGMSIHNKTQTPYEEPDTAIFNQPVGGMMIDDRPISDIFKPQDMRIEIYDPEHSTWKEWNESSSILEDQNQQIRWRQILDGDGTPYIEIDFALDTGDGWVDSDIYAESRGTGNHTISVPLGRSDHEELYLPVEGSLEQGTIDIEGGNTRNTVSDGTVRIGQKQDHDTSIVGHWRLDDDVAGTNGFVRDFSRYDNHGLTKAGIETGVDGVLSQKGMRFDGSASYIDLGDSPSLDIIDGITITAWFKSNDCGGGANRDILVKAPTSSWDTANYRFMTQSDGTLMFARGNGTQHSSVSGDEIVCDGEWHHLAYKDETIYVDGEIDTAGTIDYEWYTNDASLRMGVNEDENADNVLNGVLSNVRLYDRVLSDQEVSQLASNGLAVYSTSWFDGGGETTWQTVEADHDAEETTSTQTRLQTAGDIRTLDAMTLGASTTDGALTIPIAENGAVGAWNSSSVKQWTHDATDAKQGSYSYSVETSGNSTDYDDVFYDYGWPRKPDSTQWWIKAPNPENGNWIHRTNFYDGTRENILTSLAFDGATTGGIAVLDGSSGWHTISSSYPSNEWISLRIDWDFDNYEFDVYYNGEYVRTEPFRNNIDGFRVHETAWDYDEGGITANYDFTPSVGLTESRVSDWVRSDRINWISWAEDQAGQEIEPVAHWTFNEGEGSTAFDKISGHELPLSSENSWADECRFGSCLDIDGVSNSASAHLVWEDKVAATAWIYPENISSRQSIFVHGQGGRSYQLEIKGSGELGHTMQQADCDNWNSAGSTLDLERKNWQLVGFSHTASEGTTFFVNEKSDQVSNTGELCQNATEGSFRLANSGGNRWDSFQGRIDDVKIYDTPLSSNDIKTMYRSSAESHRSTTVQIRAGKWDYQDADSLIASWLFEGAGGLIRDEKQGIELQRGEGIANPNRVSGYPGQAFRFNGTDWLKTDLNISQHDDFSVEVWARWDNLSGSSGNLGNAAFRSDAPHDFQIAIYGGNGDQIRSYVNTRDGSNGGGDAIGYSLTETGIAEGTWHHVTLVRNEGTLELYVDGEQASSRSDFEADWSPNTYEWIWGQDSGGVDFQGAVSETRLYSRALTASEVSALYNVSSFTTVSEEPTGDYIESPVQNKDGIVIDDPVYQVKTNLQTTDGRKNPGVSQMTLGESVADSKNNRVVFDTVGDDSWTVPDDVEKVEVLVVGGGGGAGSNGGGGGGAGGVVYEPQYEVESGTTVDVSVGAGGEGRTWSNGGLNGENSEFGSLVAYGGGGGGSAAGSISEPSKNGGSGGGGGQVTADTGGTGNQSKSLSGGYGTAGGQGINDGGGGGGGAGTPGRQGTAEHVGGQGGDGIYVGDIFGRDIGVNGWLAAGGGGGSNYGDGDPNGGQYGPGGRGGAGDGVNIGQRGRDGQDAVANTGSGGGGADQSGKGGNGGSGIVVVQWSDNNGSYARSDSRLWANESFKSPEVSDIRTKGTSRINEESFDLAGQAEPWGTLTNNRSNDNASFIAQSLRKGKIHQILDQVRLSQEVSEMDPLEWSLGSGTSGTIDTEDTNPQTEPSFISDQPFSWTDASLETVADQMAADYLANNTKDTISNIWQHTRGVDLTGYWPFDSAAGEKVSDSSVQEESGSIENRVMDGTMNGIQHNGTMIGDATGDLEYGPEWINDGTRGDVLAFEATQDDRGTRGEDQVNMSDVFDFGNGDSFTLSAWAYLNNPHPVTPIKDGSPTSAQMPILSRGDGCHGYGLVYYVDADDNIQEAKLFLRESGCGQVDEAVFTDSSVIRNQWHHITGVYDAGTQEIKLYINGEPVDITSVAGDNTFGSAENFGMSMGWIGNDGRNLDGRLDDARVHKQPLSDGEVKQLYAGERIEDGLVGEWGFEEGEGDVAYDSSIWADSPVRDTVLQFDGSQNEQRVNIPHDDSFSFTSTGTVQFWAKIDDGMGDHTQTLVRKDEAWTIDYHENDELAISMNDAYSWSQTEIELEEGTWYHLTMRNDGSNQEVFINGEKRFSEQANSGITTSTNDLWFGDDPTRTNRALNGMLSDVRIYSDALTEQEIREGMRGQRPQDNIVGYWPLEEGTNNTLYNTRFRTGGKEGGAVRFDGQQRYVSANGSELDLTQNNEFTVCAWIYPTSDSDRPAIVGQRSPFLMDWSFNNVQLIVEEDWDDNVASRTLGLNTWHHVCGQYDDTDEEARIIIDGETDAEYQKSWTLSASDQDLLIGHRDTADGPQWFEGRISDVRIYDEAVSLAEINGAMEGQPPDESIVARYTFGESAGNEVFNTEIIRDGRFAGAGHFDDDDDRITIGEPDQYAYAPLTVMGWIRIEDLVNDRQTMAAVTDRRSGRSEVSWQFQVSDDGSEIDQLILESYYNDDLYAAKMDVTTADIETQEWAHVACTLDDAHGNGLYRCFVNGEEYPYNVQSNDGGVNKYGEKLRLGYEFGNTRSLHGALDDFRIYDKALSKKEIKRIATTSPDNSLNMFRNENGRSVTVAEESFNATIRNDVVGAWSFDEGSGDTVFDTTNNQLDASAQGDPTWNDGIFDGAMAFDGNDDYLDIRSTDDIEFGKQSFTATAWARTDETDTFQQLFDKRTSNRNDDPEEPGWYLRPVRGNDYAEFVISDGQGNLAQAVGTEYSDDEWHHYAAVRDAQDTVYLYIDGELEGSSSSNVGDISQEAVNLAIGGRQNWNGSIDNVRLYERALSQSAIKSDMERPVDGPILTRHGNRSVENQRWVTIEDELKMPGNSYTIPSSLETDGNNSVDPLLDLDPSQDPSNPIRSEHVDGSSTLSISAGETRNFEINTTIRDADDTVKQTCNQQLPAGDGTLACEYQIQTGDPLGTWSVTVESQYHDGSYSDQTTHEFEVIEIDNVSIEVEYDVSGSHDTYVDGEIRSEGSYGGLDYPYVAAEMDDYVTGIVNYGDFLNLDWSQQNGRQSVRMTQDIGEQSHFLLPLYQGDNDGIERRQGNIRGGILSNPDFLTYPSPNFGRSLTEEKQIKATLSYDEDERIIRGFNGSLGSGRHSLIVEHEGQNDAGVDILGVYRDE